VLALAWRACLAVRWRIVLLGAPLAVAAVGARALTSSLVEESLPVAWQEMAFMGQNVVIQCAAYVAVTYGALSWMRGRSQGIRDVLSIPWRRVPAALAAGFLLQGMTWWPEPLLDWNDDGDYFILANYAILIVNVLLFDVLTFVWLPVLVMERWSIVAAFGRGVRLAVRHPWRLLAIDGGYWWVYFLFSGAVRQVYWTIDPEWADVAWNVMIAVWITFTIPVTCCLAAAAYHLIRGEHEGPAPETLARVFD
jgi:hypothetical protein